MAKPIDIPADRILEAVSAWRDETERGAAVLAGSMVENALGYFLSCYCRARADKETVSRLFDATGPINSFAQRILIARAFGLIDAKKQKQFGLIREIRNHFAHHPLEASFNDTYVLSRVEKLGYTHVLALDPKIRKRGVFKTSYLVACAGHSSTFQVCSEHVETLFPYVASQA